MAHPHTLSLLYKMVLTPFSFKGSSLIPARGTCSKELDLCSFFELKHNAFYYPRRFPMNVIMLTPFITLLYFTEGIIIHSMTIYAYHLLIILF